MALAVPLGLATMAVLVVFSRYCGENIEYHRLDRGEHAAGAIGGHEVEQVERDDTDLLGIDQTKQAHPVGRGEAGRPVDLLHQKHVAGFAVVEQSEQLKPTQLGPALVFDIARRETQSLLNRKGVEPAASA